jgi:hypothetical protein
LTVPKCGAAGAGGKVYLSPQNSQLNNGTVSSVPRTYTNVANVDTVTVNSAFTGSDNPAYLGNVVQTLKLESTGGLTGELPISKRGVSPYFDDTVSLNTGKWLLSYDFSGLPGGCMPAGASFYLEDFDGGSLLENIRATDVNGNTITNQWVSTDVIYGANPSPNPSQPTPVYPQDYPVSTSTGPGVYQIKAPTRTSDNPTAQYLTQQCVKTISFSSYSPKGIINQLSFLDEVCAP